MFQDMRETRIHLGPQPTHATEHKVKLSVRNLDFWYGAKQALRNVSLDIYANEVTALIGPSGCGKSTLLQSLNRTNEIIPGVRREGTILLDGMDVYDPDLDPPLVRQRFGWIAQQPNPFPRSIRANILYGPEIQGLVHDAAERAALVERSLRKVGLWEEVKDRLDGQGDDLSIGQQQRLCIARAIATSPEVLLMDEPTSALDPGSTALIEELIDRLRKQYTVVIITHNIQQAARISQRIAFFHLGEMIEAGDTEQMILAPRTERCQRFVTGRYG